ncbi:MULTISPECIES: hypothetical protein [Aphanizomenonaceae]|jgi:hypothetical protein|uniref:Uncharacterized protein n=1 Tax=Dolichospermum heterosporum TAC447 TaxID=747523 RepID=A0ABY5LTF2_9CYAN|nr:MULTISPECIES: hypothetical protein [Aphanizomenonaceae]MBE9257188.1 hypothetical protein [Dolichospermum sp. LEGE 00246]MDK2408832.1 hypothetical protein [Aphanizomenon sp. 202]MDK2459652.1 hypothetical protein [Aphanizomenon sp. PH219]UUO14151.1 hypothetical protein NG743_19180 [Dolichospermum heterosporum TAC447]
MSIQGTPPTVSQTALAALVDAFIQQGHPPHYAQAMATSIIFQTDLDLRNAQMANLLGWLKEEHQDIYPFALAVVEKTCSDFERQVQEG